MDLWAVECLDCDVFETLKLLSRSGLGSNRLPIAISIQGWQNYNRRLNICTEKQTSICRR